jgi:hypothetical protein
VPNKQLVFGLFQYLSRCRVSDIHTLESRADAASRLPLVKLTVGMFRFFAHPTQPLRVPRQDKEQIFKEIRSGKRARPLCSTLCAMSTSNGIHGEELAFEGQDLFNKTSSSMPNKAHTPTDAEQGSSNGTDAPSRPSVRSADSTRR